MNDARSNTVTRKDPKQIVSAARWKSVCDSLGLAGGDRDYARLVRAWTSFGRRYHTIEHLAACLLEFDCARDLAQSPAQVELALWFHDAVYRTYRGDNELRSAEWAVRFLAENGASAEVAQEVRELVMATAHAAAQLTGDAALVVDIDLAILGRPEAIYDQFERDVRSEYWWVPKRRFVAARCGILQSFLERRSIYHWPRFRERYEETARANLRRAIDALQST